MHNLSFKERNKELNEAEIKCEEFFKQHQIPFTRYGFDCLKTIGKEFNSIPRVLQGTPDYMAFVKNKGITRSILIEAKMGGKVLRLKLCDMEAYDWWVKVNPVTMFLYSKTYDEHKLIPYRHLKRIAVQSPKDMYSDNGKVYHKIKWEDIK
jgi:hypothetical protein